MATIMGPPFRCRGLVEFSYQSSISALQRHQCEHGMVADGGLFPQHAGGPGSFLQTVLDVTNGFGGEDRLLLVLTILLERCLDLDVEIGHGSPGLWVHRDSGGS